MRFRSQLEKDEHSDIYHWYFPVPEEVAENGKPDHKLLNMEIKAANQAAKRG